MDANSGEPWSEMDISDLTNELARGQTMAQTASFLCRDEDDSAEGAGLADGPRKEKPRRSGAFRRLRRGEPPRFGAFVRSGPTLRHLFHPSQDGASHSLRKCGRATDTFGGGATH